MKTLIIVLGHAGSGKTTTTNYLTDILSNAETIKFAKPLYMVHNFFFRTGPKRRWFLLFLGNLISFFKLRRFICSSWVKNVKNCFSKKNREIVLCDDLRFPAEAKSVYKLGCNGIYQKLIVIYLNTSMENCKNRSLNSDKQMRHDSENHIQECWEQIHTELGPRLMLEHHVIYHDLILPNNNDIKTLYKTLDNFIGGLLI